MDNSIVYMTGKEKIGKLYKDYEKSLSPDKEISSVTNIEFILSNTDNSARNLLGRYNSNHDRVDVFLDKIGNFCYDILKRENESLFDFLESEANGKSKALDRGHFEDFIDEQLFAYTKDKITEVLLHELTHKFGNARHPQDYKAGINYFINSYISKLYTEASFSGMEKEAKEMLKKYYKIQSYTTNDFNSKIRKLIDYCNDR